MRKILFFIILTISTSSIFASINKSISTNLSVFATSFSIEYNINDTTQISIPFGVSLIDTYYNEIPPMYIGLLSEKILNKYIPGEYTSQLKFGFGLALIYNLDKLDPEEFTNLVFVPVLSAQLEEHFTKNHSIYLRATPPLLFAVFKNNGIKINAFNASSVFNYLSTLEVLSIATFSFGYRYTYN